MEYLLTADEMRRYDSYTSTELLIPDIVLMERAAYGAYLSIQEDIDKGRFVKYGASFMILCGAGNNGGDGLALARLLYQKRLRIKVIIVGDMAKASRLNLLEQQILAKYGIEVIKKDALGAAQMLDGDASNSIVIDALFGVGLNRPLEGDYAYLAARINQSGSCVYALDIPSGLNADGTGHVKDCVRADVTLTFGFKKIAHVLSPYAFACGEVRLIDMGIDDNSIAGDTPGCRCITERSDIPWPRRRQDANKGTYGKLLVIAGSRDVYGAAYMAARAAFEMGIGMVRLITHINNICALETALPEAMYSFYDDYATQNELDDMLRNAYKWADGILIGPGVGLDDTARSLTVSALCGNDLPVVIDADAVRLIADNEELITYLKGNDNRKVIMTPHMGEYAYLCHTSVDELKTDIISSVKKTADALRISIICKDARSVIASHTGREIYINPSGNEGMATAGSGDVLAGMCAVMLIQTDDVYIAGAGAAYLHGLAGDDAAAGCGSVSMSATDIIDSIGRIVGRDNV